MLADWTGLPHWPATSSAGQMPTLWQSDAMTQESHLGFLALQQFRP